MCLAGGANIVIMESLYRRQGGGSLLISPMDKPRPLDQLLGRSWLSDCTQSFTIGCLVMRRTDELTLNGGRRQWEPAGA